jgi:hypothetical protein
MPETLLLKFTIYLFSCVIIIIMAVFSLENYVTTLNPKAQLFPDLNCKFRHDKQEGLNYVWGSWIRCIIKFIDTIFLSLRTPTHTGAL